MESNETPEACLVREFKEETGLEVGIGPCVGKGMLTIAPPHVPFAATVSIWAYGCQLRRSPMPANQKVAISSEHHEWAWIPVAELRAKSDLPELYKSYILSWAQRDHS